MYVPTLTKVILAVVLGVLPLTATSSPLAGVAAAAPAAVRIPTTVPDHWVNPTKYIPKPGPGEVWETPFGPASKFEGFAEAHGYNGSHYHYGNETGTLTRRTSVAGVYACNGANWHGPCSYTIASGGQCHSYPYGWYSSFGPDHGIKCFWDESSRNCQYIDTKQFVQYPGCPETGSYPCSYWIGMPAPTSYRCQWNT